MRSCISTPIDSFEGSRAAARAITHLEAVGHCCENAAPSKYDLARIEAFGVETRGLRFHPPKAKHRPEDIFAEPSPVGLRGEVVEDALDLALHRRLGQM